MLLKSSNKFSKWNVAKIHSFYTPSCNLKILPTTNDFKKLNHSFLLVTPTMMSYEFPIPLDEDVAKVYKFYDSSPIQLSPRVVLVYTRAKLLEKAFGVCV